MFNIYHDIYIKSTAEAIFEAVTTPLALEKWWPQHCSGSALVGVEYRFYFEKEYDWYGIVTKVVPSNYFEIQMTKSDPDWNHTKFSFHIKPENGGCWLEFNHINWPKNNHHFRRSSFCWAILLQGLKNYLEKDEIIPYPDRA